jgi:hypothetical protein
VPVLHRRDQECRTHSIDDKKNPLRVACDQEPTNKGSAQERLPRSCGHFKEELALTLPVELLTHFVDGRDLVPTETDVCTEPAKVVRGKHIRHQGAGWLEIFQAKVFEVGRGRKAFDPEGVLFIRPSEVPEPVLPAVRQNDERGPQILGVPSGLLFGVVRVLIFSLRLHDAKGAEFAGKNVICSTTNAVEFEADLQRIFEVPTAFGEGLVDENARKCFGVYGHSINMPFPSGL